MEVKREDSKHSLEDTDDSRPKKLLKTEDEDGKIDFVPMTIKTEPSSNFKAEDSPETDQNMETEASESELNKATDTETETLTVEKKKKKKKKKRWVLGCDPLPNLPKPVLARVLGMLSMKDLTNVCRVCSRWRKLGKKLRGFKKKKKCSKQENYNFEEPGWLNEISKVKKLRKLKIRNRSVCSPAIPDTQGYEGFIVRALRLQEVNISKDDLAVMLSYCLNLRSLILVGIELDSQIFQVIAKKHEKLTILRIKNCSVTADDINLVLQNCPRLDTLVLGFPETELSGQCETVVEWHRPLRCLKVYNWGSLASDDDIETLVLKCPNIENLSIVHVSGAFTEKSVESLSRLSNLKTLNFMIRGTVSPVDFCRLSVLRSLTILGLFGVTISPEELQRVQGSLPGVCVRWNQKQPPLRVKF